MHLCHLYFSDDFRIMASLKILLFSSRNNSVDICVEIRPVLICSRISLTFVEGVIMILVVAFFFPSLS